MTKSSKVKIINQNGQYQLTVDQKPFYINGAGLEFGDLEQLSKNNGNSFRTWRVENGIRSGKEVLDEAFKYGLKVAMGIEVGRERHGFDYDDPLAVKKQLESIKTDIEELKDHPALLLWVIGNELNLKYSNPKVWDAVNDISKMIHEIDPNHPTTTPLAGINKPDIDYIKERCQDLDCLSIQMYGELNRLPELLIDFGWTGPYIVSEWGVTGHWEVQNTTWGAPIEENSTIKASRIAERYKDGILSNRDQCLGSYLFLWGQKQERTPTWYGMFTEDGKALESVEVMNSLWSNFKISNKAPKIKTFLLNRKDAYQNVELIKQKEYLSKLLLSSDDSDLCYKWEVLLESTDLKEGGDQEERPKKIDITVLDSNKGELRFLAPDTGLYRLFLYVSKGNDFVSTANIPFRVL